LKVFIANFGRENYAWPDCQARGTVATMNHVDGQVLWEAGDREGYIASRMQGKTARGITPTRPVASRWFNLMTIIHETEGDVWIHREGSQLWWTTSRTGSPQYVRITEPVGDKREVVVAHKPCDPWSNQTRKGNRLEWGTLQARAKEFLFTESTLQELRPDNAAYALALIAGDDLSAWHDRSDWKQKSLKAGKNPGVVFNARQKSVAIMVRRAFEAAAAGNGQEVTRIAKNKEVEMSALELERYVDQLITEQDGLCAISGLPLEFHGAEHDQEMLCSLDRIDSGGHYAEGNLQVVCQFINRWKGASDNSEFSRLVSVLQYQLL